MALSMIAGALMTLLRNMAIIFLTIVYTLGGGLFFQFMEKGHVGECRTCLVERLRYTALNSLQKISLPINQSSFVTDHGLQQEQEKWSRKASTVLAAYQNELFRVFMYGWDGDYPEANIKEDTWPFEDAVLYSVTVVTTIGYGNVTPKTSKGKIGTIVYALAGIPLTILCLAAIGNAQAKMIRHFWRCIRSKSALNPKTDEEGTVGLEDEDVAKLMLVPLPASVLFIVIYLTIGAFLFSYLEDWAMVTAFYFCFVSLSTIGFGDYVPGKSKMLSENRGVKMTITMVYLFVGLALLSTCFQLIQETLVEQIKDVARKLKIVKT